MRTNWDNFFIGLNEVTNKLFIGRGFLSDDGTINYKSKSNDKTFEIVNAVANMMKKKMSKNIKDGKHYFGYKLPHCGKLILIEDGYNFDVYKDNSGGKYNNL